MKGDAAAPSALYTGEQRIAADAMSLNKRTILTGLAGGFALVMLLLSVAAVATMRRAETIHYAAHAAVSEHLAASRATDAFQLQQERMGRLLFDLVDAETIDAALAWRARHLALDIAGMAHASAGVALPSELHSAATAFTSAAERLVAARAAEREAAETALEAAYDRFVAESARTVRGQAERSAQIEREIQKQSEQLRFESLALLSAAIGLALLGAVITIRITARSLDTMNWQAEELGRVSWHMLRSQEETARRFSHEMHDELGQSLTGLKAVLQGMDAREFAQRRGGCIRLLDEAIGNVRELSQLLRPVVLDDFGLDAALRWLAERFSERTRISVSCECDLAGRRLPDDVETHLFRITQEALTNVARHSGATATRIALNESAGLVSLTVEDNGRGLGGKTVRSAPSLGLVGMRARARRIGGELQVESSPLGGVRIMVCAPFTEVAADAAEENAHTAG